MPTDRIHSRGTRRAGFPILAVLLAAICIFAAGCHPKGPTAEWTFDDYYQAGLEAYRNRDDKKAEQLFQVAIQKDSLIASAHYYLAVIYAERGDNDLAVTGFLKAIELEPNFPEAYYNLGTLHIKRGEVVLAAQTLEKSISLRPDYAPAYVNLGKAYFLSNLPEMAGAAFEEALTRDPENRPALQNLVALARAAGNREAEEQYQKRLGALTN